MGKINFIYRGLYPTHCELSDYLKTWDFQREIHEQVQQKLIPSQVIYVQHPPVYTAGRRTADIERPIDTTPVIDVDRGGKITYHGPGQLVGYPILFLNRGIGVVDYVRRLEEAIIRYLASYQLVAGRVPGRSGVWIPASHGLPERKICAIGIRFARQTTLHGFGLNISTQLSHFNKIIPCGITDAGVTSLAQEFTLTKSEYRVPDLYQVAQELEPYLAEMFAFQPYLPSPDITRNDRSSSAS